MTTATIIKFSDRCKNYIKVEREHDAWGGVTSITLYKQRPDKTWESFLHCGTDDITELAYFAITGEEIRKQHHYAHYALEEVIKNYKYEKTIMDKVKEEME